MRFTAPVTFDAANRKKDKSVKLAFTTNLEIPTPEYIIMDMLTQQSGWLIFGDSEADQHVEIPAEPAPTGDRKTKGQRLRAVMYLIWRDKTDQTQLFDQWFDIQFERLLDKYKERLD